MGDFTVSCNDSVGCSNESQLLGLDTFVRYQDISPALRCTNKSIKQPLHIQESLPLIQKFSEKHPLALVATDLTSYQSSYPQYDQGLPGTALEVSNPLCSPNFQFYLVKFSQDSSLAELQVFDLDNQAAISERLENLKHLHSNVQTYDELHHKINQLAQLAYRRKSLVSNNISQPPKNQGHFALEFLDALKFASLLLPDPTVGVTLASIVQVTQTIVKLFVRESTSPIFDLVEKLADYLPGELQSPTKAINLLAKDFYPHPVELHNTNAQNNATHQVITLSRVNFRNANLANASFQDANLRGADFQGANLSNANFQGANLLGADFQGADLLGANFQDANLSNANWQETLLREEDIERANLQRDDFPGARISSSSRNNSSSVCSPSTPIDVSECETSVQSSTEEELPSLKDKLLPSCRGNLGVAELRDESKAAMLEIPRNLHRVVFEQTRSRFEQDRADYKVEPPIEHPTAEVLLPSPPNEVPSSEDKQSEVTPEQSRDKIFTLAGAISPSSGEEEASSELSNSLGLCPEIVSHEPTVHSRSIFNQIPTVHPTRRVSVGC